ncbi:MAG: TIGR03620 family F420-dependent LLM class oxidoreductase [Actinomycetota bacterium]|nr:TIGR03620 family F420-dependent LLM class oxidoreductase [Actinomycetota bacterium]MDH5223295.1 TIGR03620 family F420-dependent LLM class oxidoreductase [Actinomycetota bacterium]MDH5313396.1 TIGR03620 family F420-dependent LLM class oxidoreductase [Actinomycetota bacterium]
MGRDQEAVRTAIGSIGAWTFAFDSRSVGQIGDDARALESSGYGALWVPEGSSSRDVFAHLSVLAAATSRVTVCSGIANITARAPEVMAGGARTLADAWGDRIVLGIGIGHEYSTEARGIVWDRPLARMRAYLDRMDEAPWTAPEPAAGVHRLLAALGDGMLRLSADRALGAHTYFVPVEHTRHAREVLGPDPVLAVELTAVLETDAVRARSVARGWTAGYLELPNYAKNLDRMGFGAAERVDGGSDRLVDATVAWGDEGAIAARVLEHLAAGADHVCVQFVNGDDADVCLPAYQSLAPLVLDA